MKNSEHQSFCNGMRRFRGVCLALCLLPGALYAADDIQFWPEAHLTVPAATNLKIQIGTQYRLDDHGTFLYQHTDIGLAYTGLAKWLDVSLNYKLVFEKISDDTWSYAMQPNLNATARFRLLGLTFSDRVRLEYSSPEDLSDFGIIRNKISLNPPIYLEAMRERHFLGAQKVRPYVSYEFFYTTDFGKISRHRYQGGLSLSFNTRVICDLYYMRQETLEEGRFNGLNIIGLNLSLLF